jgi:hypothetical protein
MGYRLLAIVLWRVVKWLVRRELGGRQLPKPVLYAGGLAVVAVIAAFVLSRKGDAEPAPE